MKRFIPCEINFGSLKRYGKYKRLLLIASDKQPQAGGKQAITQRKPRTPRCPHVLTESGDPRGLQSPGELCSLDPPPLPSRLAAPTWPLLEQWPQQGPVRNQPKELLLFGSRNSELEVIQGNVADGSISSCHFSKESWQG